MKKEAIIKELHDVVLEGRLEESAPLAEKSIELGYDPLEILQGITTALRIVGERFNEESIFLTDLLYSGGAAKGAMNILTEEIRRQKKEVPHIGRVVIGSVEGDIHDIGKSLVIAMLSAEGFEVFDLGIDVSAAVFVEKVRELKPDVLGLSALVTNTMLKFRDVITSLEEAGLRNKVKVIVGGALVTKNYADISGADVFGSDAIDGVVKVKALLGLR